MTPPVVRAADRSHFFLAEGGSARSRSNVFHDVSFIEVKPHVKGNQVAVELTDFSVFYSQDSIANAEATLKNKANKIVVEKGQIVKVSKDKDGKIKKEVLTKHWTDWIDYWSVDFDFESKREIIRVPRGLAPFAQSAEQKVPVLPSPSPRNGKNVGLVTMFSKTNGNRSGRRRTGHWNSKVRPTNARRENASWP